LALGHALPPDSAPQHRGPPDHRRPLDAARSGSQAPRTPSGDGGVASCRPRMGRRGRDHHRALRCEGSACPRMGGRGRHRALRCEGSACPRKGGRGRHRALRCEGSACPRKRGRGRHRTLRCEGSACHSLSGAGQTAATERAAEEEEDAPQGHARRRRPRQTCRRRPGARALDHGPRRR